MSSYAIYHFLVGNTVGIGKSKLMPNFKKMDPAFDPGTKHMITWNADDPKSYLAKVVKYGKSEEDLKADSEDYRSDLNSKLGKGGKKVLETIRSATKHRKRLVAEVLSTSESDEENDEEDEEEEEEAISEKEKKKRKKKMASTAARDILKQIEETESIESGREKEKDLQEQLNSLRQAYTKLQEENAQLKLVISTIQGLPSLLARMETLTGNEKPASQSQPIYIPSKILSSSASSSYSSSKASTSSCNVIQFGSSSSPDTNQQSPVVVENASELQQPKRFRISSSLLNRCSRASAKKFTNDLLHGLFDQKYLATHSVTGGKSAKHPDAETVKPGIEPGILRDILDAVIDAFPDRKPTETEVKSYIRVKLNNSAATSDIKNKKSQSSNPI